MHRWGHIKCFRFDNGLPFGDPRRECMTPSALHLVARGCEVKFNPPRSPTRNAKVERNQGTTAKWADIKTSANFSTFYENLRYAVIVQREKYPTRVCNYQTRMKYYPALTKNPRKYNSLDFDKIRVYKKLAQGKWFRKVSSHGQIKIFGKVYQAGFKYRGQSIIVKLIIENEKPYWQCYNQNQEPIAKLFAENIADESYYKLH